MGSHSSTKASMGRKMAKWLLAVALFLLVLPEILRFAAVKVIPSTGLGEAVIGDIDVNLFSGVVVVKQLSLRRDGASKLDVKRLSVDVNWLKLLLGEFHIEALSIDGVRLAVVEAADGRWEVVVPIIGDQQGATTTINEQTFVLPKVALRTLSLNDVELKVQSQSVEGLLTIDELTLKQASTWLQQQASLEMTAAWDGAPVSLSLDARLWQKIPSVEGRLQLSHFQLSGITLPGNHTLQGMVDMDIEFNAEHLPSGAINSVLEGQISLDKFATQYRDISVDNEVLQWVGTADLNVVDEQWAYSLAGNLQSSGLSMVDQRHQIPLLNWDSFSMDGFALDQTRTLAIEKIRLLAVDAVNSGSEEQGRLYTGAVIVNDLKLLQGQQLIIEKVELQDGQYHILVTPESTLRVESVLASVLSRLQQKIPAVSTAEVIASQVDEGAALNPDVEKEVNSTDKFILAIKQFDVTGDSYLKCTDQRFSAPVRQQLTIQQLTVANLDQRQPPLSTSLKFLGRIGEFSKIAIDGQAKPFAEKPLWSLKGKLEAIELPGISPYSEAYLGYHLTRGQYDHQFDLEIANDEINLNNTLVLRQLALKSVDPDKPQPVEKQLDMPLAFALDMLRDGEDNIELNVPIDGRVDDPDINVNDIINDALGYALKNGAASYLTLALQPYGAVLMAADFVGEQLSTIRLEPIVFTVGEGELRPEQLDYTARITGLLQQRPKLNLTICGQANDSDKGFMAASQPAIPVEEAQLVALAEQRAKAVKRQFIDKGIENSRLFLCQPQYQPEMASAVTLTL